jgi:hypothetical protein
MRRLPAVQQLTAVNDRLSLQVTAGPDPKQSVNLFESGPKTLEITGLHV